ncbi:MAG TPA: hypothetical protein VG842_12295, partial [Sediminibacterium sp.]|nr:hypothetical protein [Sediminibacterium sp.]
IRSLPLQPFSLLVFSVKPSKFWRDFLWYKKILRLPVTPRRDSIPSDLLPYFVAICSEAGDKIVQEKKAGSGKTLHNKPP